MARHTIYDGIESPNRAVLSRMVDRAMLDGSTCERFNAGPLISRVNSIEPRCFAPQVDATHSRQAYGKLALPKLAQELNRKDGKIVRQAVTSIADISVNPEETGRIIQLGITERLADLLLAEDPYLRERVAMIYATLSRQSSGREAIFRNPKILNNLSKGLHDPFPVVREKMARVIEILARLSIADDNLCTYGFLEILVDLIETEKENTILAVHLESLECLLNGNAKKQAIELKTIEKLVSLLVNNKDENIVAEVLYCLSILAQEPTAKQKFREMDRLSDLKKFLDSPIHSVHKNAAALVVFATTTTPGKLRAFELDIVPRLVVLAGIANDPRLQIYSMQALSNIAEVPEGKAILLEEYSMFIEDIESYKDEGAERHKNVLLNMIRSRP